VSAATLPLPWLGALTCALGTAALVALAHGVAREPALRARALAYAARLEADLRYLQLCATGEQIAAGQAVGSLCLVALSLLLATPWPLVGVTLVVAVPRRWLAHRRRQRSTQVAAQVDTALVAIANALESGSSLGEALSSAVHVLPSPLRDELTLTLRESALGVPLDQALGNLAARVERPTVTAALVTLQVARNTGGEVIRALRTCAASLRELTRLEGVVQSKTAEARAQALVIAVIPAPLLGLLDRLDPDFLKPVWSTTRGHLVLAVATALWAAAVWLAREIMDVDV